MDLTKMDERGRRFNGREIRKSMENIRETVVVDTESWPHAHPNISLVCDRWGDCTCEYDLNRVYN